ncbi:MAG: DNA-binding domain-containing protein [Gammaproteobacteria bacterium]|jgi:hypothetical protein
MNTLRELQDNFIANVFDSNDNGFNQSILSNSISGARRLQIYHNNIYISLTDALNAVYPVVNRLVDDEFFRFMATEYIAAHPSRSGNLHDFGNQFAHFIKSFQPAGELVYLSDVARLEWAYHSVFHAADSPNFDITKLEQITEQDYHKLVFTPNPASQLIESPYPILQIWEANQDDRELDKNNNAIPETISLDDGETHLLVIRRNLDIEFQTMGYAEYAFLAACYKQNNFFAACDAATQVEPECNVGQLLLKHIQTHTLISFALQY